MASAARREIGTTAQAHAKEREGIEDAEDHLGERRAADPHRDPRHERRDGRAEDLEGGERGSPSAAWRNQSQ